MIIKICGITNGEDALAAVKGGATALGFNFYPQSPRYVEPDDVIRLVESLPASVLKVGVFVNESPDRVIQIVQRTGLDIAQLHGDEASDSLPQGVRVWKAFRVDAAFDLDRLDEYPVEAFLLDSASSDLYGGSGVSFDWSLVRSCQHRIVLAGGLYAGNVAQAILEVRPWGVDACSRIEKSPGCKDHARMRQFLEAALLESE